MTDDLLLYGSYGYTGDLIARAAVEAGLSPTLAGRDREQVEAQAAELGLDTRVFGLDSSRIVERKLDDASVVLNCAGPFIHTYEPLVEACLETGTHYLDITGEIDVFEAIAAREERAAEAGVMALPGVGFDVVPSDCLANHLVEQLPEATHLALGFTDLGGVSPGTAATVVESLGGGSVVREDGDLREVPLGERTRTIDFGEGARLATSIPWGDVSTAYRSTGIPNVEFYTGVSETELRVLKNLRSLGRLLGSGPVQPSCERWSSAASRDRTSASAVRARACCGARSATKRGTRSRRGCTGPRPTPSPWRRRSRCSNGCSTATPPPGIRRPPRPTGTIWCSTSRASRSSDDRAVVEARAEN